MYKTGYVGSLKIPAEFHVDAVHIENGTRYRECQLRAPWGRVTQTVREDNLKDAKGNKLFEEKETAEAP